MENPSGNRTVSDGKRKPSGTISRVATSFELAAARSSTMSAVRRGGGLVLLLLASGVAAGVTVPLTGEDEGALAGAVARVAVAGTERDVDRVPEHETSATPRRQTMTTGRAMIMG